MKSPEMMAFEDWLFVNNTPGSRKADSYVTVIENIGQILKRLPEFAEIQDDLCKIDDPFLLRRIRNVVLAEQKKPNGGIFAGTVLTQGYWGRNFCSATITNLIQYKMHQFNG